MIVYMRIKYLVSDCVHKNNVNANVHQFLDYGRSKKNSVVTDKIWVCSYLVVSY
jgi:hypothetical protein